MSNAKIAAKCGAKPSPRSSEILRGRLYAGLQYLRGRPLTRFVRQLQEWEQLRPDEFELLHEQRLRWILDYARAHVPLYQNGLWQRSLSVGKFGLEAWPVIEKEVLRTRFEALLAKPQAARIVTHRTSGSTGMPARIAMTHHADTWGWAHRYQGLRWHGIPIGVRSLRLSHDSRPLRDWVLGQKSVPSLSSRECIDEAVQFLLDERPTLVAGPPSTLFYLARRLRERGMERPLAPFARVGGEQLFTFQRTEIESFLGARAINSFGCTETGALAGECRAGSLHVHAAHIHLEIFQGDSPAKIGDFGDIVVTSLLNTAMPLVRYRVGDRGRLSTERCECGLPTPVLTELQARNGDEIQAADGSWHHGARLVEGLDTFFGDSVSNDVRQINFAQIDSRTWEIWVDSAESLRTSKEDDPRRTAVEGHLARIVRQIYGTDCKASFRFVSELPRESGKYRYYRRIDRTG